jgi:hypothetical protein
MRELDGQDAPDGNDHDRDAVGGDVPDARQPRAEAIADAAMRRALSLEYQKRVEAQGAGRGDGAAGEQASRGAPGDNNGDLGAARARRSAGRDEDKHGAAADAGAGEGRAPSAESRFSWPPPESDRARVRQLYRELRAEAADWDQRGGREQGNSVVGVRPGRSPGDASELPPAGEELAEARPDRRSRFSGLLDETESKETLDELNEAAKETAGAVQQWLSARPPEGHPGQRVAPAVPHFIRSAPDQGIEAGDAASAVLVTGILAAHAVRWVDEKLRHGKDGDHDGNR